MHAGSLIRWLRKEESWQNALFVFILFKVLIYVNAYYGTAIIMSIYSVYDIIGFCTVLLIFVWFSLAFRFRLPRAWADWKKTPLFIVLFLMLRYLLIRKLGYGHIVFSFKAIALIDLLIEAAMEEWVNRKYLLHLFWRNGASYLTAVFASAAIFSLGHFDLRLSPLLFRFLSGIFYGIGALMSGGIVVPTLMHFFDNLIAFSV